MVLAGEGQWRKWVEMACKWRVNFGWGIKKRVRHMEMGWVISAGHIWPPSLLLGANPVCVWRVWAHASVKKKAPPFAIHTWAKRGQTKVTARLLPLHPSVFLSLCARFDRAGSDAGALIAAVQSPQPCLYFSAQWSERTAEGGRKSCGRVNSLWPKHQRARKQRQSVGGGRGRGRERKMGKNECLCTCRV